MTSVAIPFTRLYFAFASGYLLSYLFRSVNAIISPELTRELTLNAEQSASMRAILDRTRDDYKAVCADVRPRYDVVRERAREQMRALLTAGQQTRFDSIVTAEDCRCPELKK